MRVAALYDVRGNLPALDAVLAAISATGYLDADFVEMPRAMPSTDLAASECESCRAA